MQSQQCCRIQDRDSNECVWVVLVVVVVVVAVAVAVAVAVVVVVLVVVVVGFRTFLWHVNKQCKYRGFGSLLLNDTRVLTLFYQHAREKF